MNRGRVLNITKCTTSKKRHQLESLKKHRQPPKAAREHKQADN